MAQIIYSAVEKKVIRDAKEMGYSSTQIAALVNKKIHHGATVRTGSGIRNLVA